MVLFATPWALLLLALLPAMAAVGYRRLQRLPGRRPAIALATRLLVVGVLVAALASPQLRTSEQKVAVVFLVDASASLGPVGQRTGVSWATRATAAAGPQDRAGLILFGAAPRLAVPPAHYTALPDPQDPSAGATDIAAALRLGLSVLPPDTPGRLVLLSDGQATTGDTTDAAALALSRGVPIDTVALAPPRPRDALVQAITIPPTVRAGGTMPLRIVLHSTFATPATLTVMIDGVASQQRIALPAGDTVLGAEPTISLQQGLHTVSVRIDAPGDTVPQNNRLDAATVAGPPGSVLLAVNDPAEATALATTLARAHLAVQPALPASLPATATGYHAYDAVVLDDVPATALNGAQQRALRAAVYDDGLGLLTIGGPNAYGDGGYPRTSLEDVLPVVSVSIPQRTSPPLALMLVIDQSGSMADTVDGVAKIDMVKVAAASALDRLDTGDGVGVLAFSDDNHWIVPFHVLQGVADKAHIRQQIAGLEADGNTYIYPALQAAETAVLSMPNAFRHIVLLTDGQGEQDRPFDQLIRRMHREHIVLSTIGVGEDVVQDELRHWAALGGGNFHYVSDPHDIPRIIVNETRYGTAGSAEVRGQIRLGIAAASPLVRALSNQQLPPITAYNSTVAKTTAAVGIQSASGDPVLSSWQYGVGRVVAWTSDAGGNWAARWNPTRLPLFWTDLVGWAIRGYALPQDVPALAVRDSQLQVSLTLHGTGTPAGVAPFDDTASPQARVVGPDGTARTTALTLDGPGLYTAALPLSGPGVYTAALVVNDRAAPVPAALAVPYAREYADAGVDTALLTHLAAVSGGHALSRLADAFTHAGLPPLTSWLPLWPLLLALALLLFTLDVAVRLLLPHDPAYTARV